MKHRIRNIDRIRYIYLHIGIYYITTYYLLYRYILDRYITVPIPITQTVDTPRKWFDLLLTFTATQNRLNFHRFFYQSHVVWALMKQVEGQY
jgi:hypothetical protein